MRVRARVLLGAGILCVGCVILMERNVSAGRDAKAISAEVEKGLLADVDKELKAFGGNQSVPGAVVGVWMPGAAPWVRAECLTG